MNQTTAVKLRQLGDKIRSTLNSNDAIAEGFDLIAAAMEPCIDCQHPEEPEPAATLDPADLPDAGMDNSTAAAQV